MIRHWALLWTRQGSNWKVQTALKFSTYRRLTLRNFIFHLPLQPHIQQGLFVVDMRTGRALNWITSEIINCLNWLNYDAPYTHTLHTSFGNIHSSRMYKYIRKHESHLKEFETKRTYYPKASECLWDVRHAYQPFSPRCSGRSWIAARLIRLFFMRKVPGSYEPLFGIINKHISTLVSLPDCIANFSMNIYWQASVRFCSRRIVGRQEKRC